MKILISACAADNGKSGIGQYHRAVAERLSRHTGANLQLEIVTDHQDTFLDHLDELPYVSVQPLGRLFGGVLGSLIWHFFILPLKVLIKRPDLVLFLAANRRLSFIPAVRTVGVVHDLSQLHIKGKYDRFRTFYVLTLLTALMRRLSRIVSVSHSTKRDLVTHAGIEAKRISVVHNGAELDIFAQPASADVLENYGVESPYILYTARLEHPGKNHVRLLQAFSRLHANRDLQLVLAGSPWNGAEAIYEEVDRLGLADQVIFTGFVPQADLPALVQHAELFVFPSLFEGFGIPLLEAMAAGVPVCAANRASLPEVAGDAALLFEPDDPEDIARVMQQLVDSADLRQRLAQAGRQRAGHFTWEKSAALLLNECRRTCLLDPHRDALEVAI